MGRTKYAGDTFTSLDELELAIHAEIAAKWLSNSVQDMQELARKLDEVNRRRGIIKRKHSR